MPEQLTKHPDVTLQVLKSAGAQCGAGAAQEILIRSGALSYCAFKMLEILGEARQEVASLALPCPGPVTRLFDAHTEPLHRLFAAAGAPEGMSLSLQPS